MKKLFIILDKLTDMNIHFCLQSHGDKNFYNLKVMTPQNKQVYINEDSTAKVEERLIIIWGHLINGTTTNVKTSTALSVPIPPPMSPPC